MRLPRHRSLSWA